MESSDGLTSGDLIWIISTILLYSVLSAVTAYVLWREYRPRQHHYMPVALNGASDLPQHANHRRGASTSHQNMQSRANSMSNSGANAVSSSSNLLDDDAGTNESTGSETRRRFFILLLIASVSRVSSLIAELVLLHMDEDFTDGSLTRRLLALFLWLPSLLFITMYALVLLFWSQLCYACWGKSLPWPRRVFFVFNVSIYIALAVIFFTNSTAGGIGKSCDNLLGSLYLLGLFAMLYYSIRLLHFFSTQSPDEDFFFDLPSHRSSTSHSWTPRQVVMCRIVAVCSLLCLLFLSKGVYLLSMGTGLMPTEESDYSSPVGQRHIGSEFILHFCTEFLPAALLLFVTRPDAKASAQSTHTSSSVHMSQAKPPTPNYSFQSRTNSASYHEEPFSNGNISHQVHFNYNSTTRSGF